MHSSLQPFAAYRQFCVYQLAPRNDGSGKMDKWVINVTTGLRHDAHDPAVWMDHVQAENIAAAWGTSYGYGFVFTDNDPFWFIDIDGALTADRSAWSPIVHTLCGIFAGAAVEISTSGTGLHIFGRGTPPAHCSTNKALGLEFYHSKRFVALTGANAYGSADFDATAVMPQFCATYFPPRETGEDADWSDGPVAEWRGPSDDEEIIRRARKSRSNANTFGGKSSFDDLWTANEPALAATYPHPEKAYDASSADQALANHLAFWTGRDCARMERIMRRSELAKRDKWERQDYVERTILLACGKGGDVLQDDPPTPGTPAAAQAEREAASGVPVSPEATSEEGIELRGGSPDGFMLRNELREHFRGCIYVRSLHRAFVPGGYLLKPEQFKVTFGGHRFQLDKVGEKQTRDAWEVFTQGEIFRFPSVEGICFRPDLPEGAIVNTPGHSAVNTYVPVEVPRKTGDITPFLTHLAKVLPDERDAAILLAYMAACVQHQGVKFQWAPLIQGVEGNGKTLFTRCVAEAIGKRYVHWPRADKLAEKFNGWMMSKTFYAVEDIYVAESRREVIENLKPMITGGDGFEIEGKGVDQISVDICGNFIFNSNHRDAIRKTANDRRFCILYSAQQEFADLARSGMTEAYFQPLYKWLRSDGYAIVAEYLYTYAIPDALNPAKDCQRAPVTTSTTAAVRASLGSIEQEILEAIDQGQQGFCGGWISSHFLDKLLERLGLLRKVSPHRRKEILESLGYRHHPALRDGRTTGIVTPDNTRPRLFVHNESLALQITEPAAVAAEYQRLNTTGLRVSTPITFPRTTGVL